MQRTRVAVVALALLAFVFVPEPASSDSHRPRPLAAAPYVGEVEVARVVAYVDAVERAHAAAFWSWIGAVDEYLRSIPPPPPPPAPVSIPDSGIRNSGFHSDAWWHGVAVCEQGGRNDPFFGYFSFMDGSQGGRSWDDQVAAANTAIANAVASTGSESPAWAPSCVAAGYAASPSG